VFAIKVEIPSDDVKGVKLTPTGRPGAVRGHVPGL